MNAIYYGPCSGCMDQIVWVVQLHRGSIFSRIMKCTSWQIAWAVQYFCRRSRRISSVIWTRSCVCSRQHRSQDSGQTTKTCLNKSIQEKTMQHNTKRWCSGGIIQKLAWTKSYKRTQKPAHPGNRTPVSTVGGYYDTTTPDAPCVSECSYLPTYRIYLCESLSKTKRSKLRVGCLRLNETAGTN